MSKRLKWRNNENSMSTAATNCVAFHIIHIFEAIFLFVLEIALNWSTDDEEVPKKIGEKTRKRKAFAPK